MNHPVSRRSLAIGAMALLAVAFGLLTIKEGGSVLLGDAQARAAAGAYVPFVLWFNFLAGFAYVLAGVGFWAQRRWAALLAMGIAGGTVLTFAALGLHIVLGGAFEMRTVAAMALRSAVWLLLAWAAWRRFSASF
jgi:hypothetical protein